AHFLFGPRTYEFPAFAAGDDVDLSGLKPETKRKVDDMIGEVLKRHLDDGELKPETTLDQLGMDSLSRMELALKVEQYFRFRGDAVPTTVGQLYGLASGLLRRQAPKRPPRRWFAPVRKKPIEILAETVPAAF